MVHDNTSTVSREVATRSVLSIRHDRPEGMSRVTWEQVYRVLLCIATYYPKAYPSQMRMAARLHMPERSLRRYIAAAVKHNLLIVEADAGAAPKRCWGSNTNRYRLVSCQSYEASLASKRTPTLRVGVGTSSLETSSQGTCPARPAASLEVCPSQPQGSTVVRMSEWGAIGRQVGTNPTPAKSKIPSQRVYPTAGAVVTPLDSRQRLTKREPAPPPRWRQLAGYFAVLWEQAQMEAPFLKGIRGCENYKMMRPYIEAHFANRPDLEVRRMMEEFATAAMQGIVTIKPGQSAWLRFTGWWGRQQYVEVGDPYEEYRKKAR